jgi:lysophospholipase L1-like esterase
MVTPRANDLMPGLKDLALKLSVAVTLGVLLLSVGELAALIYLRYDSDPSPYAKLHLPADYARELEASRRTQYLPYVGWRRSHYDGRFISVDNQGVRRTLNSYCGNEKNLVVWIFGDSVLWGTGSSDAETIPSQLANLYEDAGQKVCVRNYGEVGWVSTQEVIELILQLKQLNRKPDIVVLYDGADEILTPSEGVPIGADIGYQRFRQLLDNSQNQSKPGFWYLNQTNTARALNRIAAQLRASRHSGANPNLPPQEAKTAAQLSIDNYRRNLQIVDSLAQTYGFRSFYFWYPVSAAGHKPLTREEQMFVSREAARAPQVYELTRATYALCEKLQRPNFLYLGDILDADPQQLYLDFSHLSPQGNRLVAQYMFQVLQRSKVNNHHEQGRPVPY